VNHFVIYDINIHHFPTFILLFHCILFIFVLIILCYIQYYLTVLLVRMLKVSNTLLTVFKISAFKLSFNICNTIIFHPINSVLHSYILTSTYTMDQDIPSYLNLSAYHRPNYVSTTRMGIIKRRQRQSL
jgi:Na+/phosphate symporter